MLLRPAVIAVCAVSLCAGCGGGGDDATTTSSATSTARATTPASTAAVQVASAALSVRPPAAGTAQDPRPVQVRMAVTLRQPADVDPPPASDAMLDLWPGARYAGGSLPACAATVVRRGADGCPRGSVIGTGTATALADTTRTTVAITIVNGGAGRLYLATLIKRPAYSRGVVTGTFAAAADGRGPRLRLAFPEDLQTVAGVPLGLTHLELALDRGLTTTACDGGRWSYRATIGFAGGAPATATASTACS